MLVARKCRYAIYYLGQLGRFSQFLNLASPLHLLEFRTLALHTSFHVAHGFYCSC